MCSDTLTAIRGVHSAGKAFGDVTDQRAWATEEFRRKEATMRDASVQALVSSRGETRPGLAHARRLRC